MGTTNVKLKIKKVKNVRKDVKARTGQVFLAWSQK